ncbi:F-box protein CPR30-like [Chenopodium quinoa]|uniref:F-box protein CPR30-like n=1 Tax=Chenopodium quinoa TaxID=63459 RepID=UPI000B77485D|nr:F-box protein CPR30-like [Chenopodium quinoa]
MAALPSEILADILSRVPAKPLLRFKCVCKSWNSLIKSPNFIKLHLKQTLISNSDRHLLVSSEYSSSLHSADLDLNHNLISCSELHHPLKHHNAVKLVGSCNGVVCISDESKNNVVLYNPLTKSRREIPVDQISNPSNDFIVLGFGYDSKNDGYKVLRVVDESEVILYSSNNNSWKTVGSFPYYLGYRGFSGLLVNEALHFMVTK